METGRIQTGMKTSQSRNDKSAARQVADEIGQMWKANEISVKISPRPEGAGNDIHVNRRPDPKDP